MVGLAAVAVLLTAAVLVVLGSLVPDAPTSDELARAASSAEADRPVLDEIVAEGVAELGVEITSVTYDHISNCFTDQMVPTGAAARSSKVLSTGTEASSTPLHAAYEYLERVNRERFGGSGHLSDRGDLEPPRRRASLDVDGFGFSFSDEGVDGFRVEVSGPCRTGGS